MMMAMMVVRMMGISTMIESGSVLIRLERSGEQEGSQTLGHSGALSLTINIININIIIKYLVTLAPCLQSSTSTFSHHQHHFFNINIQININIKIINNVLIKHLVTLSGALSGL